MNKVRIIGGKWRGRKLNFPDLPGVRPTPDRVRETLFNWLMRDIRGAVCLDLFAGSGAMGFEALSRGALQVVMVDSSREVVDELDKHKQYLQADNLIIHNQIIPTVNQFPYGPFDIVFLDPPFHKNLIALSTKWLDDNQLLNSNALIYLELEKSSEALPIPSHWEILKDKSAGKVRYCLCENSL